MDMNKCTFCGDVSEAETKQVNGYTILKDCYTCESEIIGKEQCEMCDNLVSYGFSLCNECDEKVDYFNENTGNYHLKDGKIIDTSKFN